MIALYGAGKELERIIEKTENKLPEEIVIVDSYPDKYPDGILGYEVRNPKIISLMTADDYVIITSTKYFEEISENIKMLNQDVAIYNIHAAKWILWFKNWIAKYISIEDNYEVKVDTEKWIESALKDEVGFWVRRVKELREKGDVRFREREFVYPYDSEVIFTENDSILDVGCGPLPVFGNRINGKIIQYIPVDPLAHQYKKLLKEQDIILPLEPKFAIMEILTYFYKENTMDYVIINNALDHCIDILRAFIECFRVVKIGGYFLMRHWEGEGLHNVYAGLHQWNITCTETDLICFNESGVKINFTKLFHLYAEIKVRRVRQGYRDFIIVRIKKKDNLPDTILEKYDDKVLIGDLIDKLFEKLV